MQFTPRSVKLATARAGLTVRQICTYKLPEAALASYATLWRYKYLVPRTLRRLAPLRKLAEEGARTMDSVVVGGAIIAEAALPDTHPIKRNNINVSTLGNFTRGWRPDVVYVEGQGDVVDALEKWHGGEDVIQQTSLTFSGQVFDFCRINGLTVHAISAFPTRKSIGFPGYCAESMPKLALAGGVGFHVTEFLQGVRLLLLLVRLRPRYLHITNGSANWLALAPLRLLGTKVVAQFHNTYWPRGFSPRGRMRRFRLLLDAWFLRRICHDAVCCSHEIMRQIEAITRGRGPALHLFKAQFNRDTFSHPAAPPAHGTGAFVVVFAGRIEEDKGVFDILEMAARTADQDVVFHICGGGPAFNSLMSRRDAMGLSGRVHLHGQLARPRLVEIYAMGHAVIVPTTTEFCEGLPMVAIEAVLLGRPVITSQVTNAFDLLGPAIVEAWADDVGSYVSAIRKLAGDKTYYEQLISACLPLREQFLDGRDGLANVLARTLDAR
jgi:glycogen(starch) synthase